MKKTQKGLKTLYGISKLLSTFESIDLTFPKILSLASEAFPLMSVVLVEHLDEPSHAVVWHSADATPEQISTSVSHARQGYAYLTGSSDESETSSKELLRNSETRSAAPTTMNNSIILPLIIDRLPPFGIIQFEGATPLDQENLEFVTALTDLICVALDRYYKSKLTLEKGHRSEEKVSELEIEKAHRELFVSMLTHDLKTPMSAALMAAQLLQRRSDDPGVQSLSMKIVGNILRADQMISDLLDANLLNSGEKLPLVLETFDLTALMRDSLDELATIHGNRFKFKVSEEIVGRWDKRGLRRIIENLCNNAIKYGEPHTPINVGLWQAEKEVKFSIQNRGEVITPENQKLLFNQFHRVEETKNSKKGWGIGLTLVRGVAEAHGGGVKVQSDEDNGTLFTVNLPRG